MSASLEQATLHARDKVLEAEVDHALADKHMVKTRIVYIREARRAGWSWERIARPLSISPNAVRQFWNRHRMTADRVSGRDSRHD